MSPFHTCTALPPILKASIRSNSRDSVIEIRAHTKLELYQPHQWSVVSLEINIKLTTQSGRFGQPMSQVQKDY